MEVDTGSVETPPEENDVIKGLRAQLKTANAAVKTAGEDALALVERGNTASSLMPKGFEGLADIYASEVDGELTADSAAAWLKGRGFSASSDEKEADDAAKAAELEAVTDLGAAVVAGGTLTPEDTIAARLAGVIKSEEPQTLTEVTEAIDAILNG